MKSKLFLLFYFLILSYQISFAQKKSAIIIGINEYYDAPGVKSKRHNLKGCVNDAKSVKSLLLNRFSFPTENIKTLLNADATAKNMNAALEQILKTGQPGDAVVFFYCGHGVYIDNPATNNDPVKRGYSEAICMSNLYAPNNGCLVKDNTLKILFNRFVEKKMILTVLFDCCYSGNLPAPPPPDDIANKYTEVYLKGNKDEPYEVFTMRDYDLNSTLKIPDASKIKKAYETPNSRFAYLSACTSQEKALEIWDEAGRPHGAFTKALISVFEKSPVDLPFYEVINRIKSEVDLTQRLAQDPQFRYDTLSRNPLNLIGLPLQKNVPKFTASTINSGYGTITINKGSNDDIMPGYVFTSIDKKRSFNVSKVFPDSSIGIITPFPQTSKGDVFVLSNRYRTSKPMLKIYIPTAAINTAEFLKIFREQVLPITKRDGYKDYYNFYKVDKTASYFFEGQPDAGITLNKIFDQLQLLVYMAIPLDIAKTIKTNLQNEQSIEIVNSAEQADYVLYLNYASVSKVNKKPSFVFTYKTALPANITSTNSAPVNFYRFAVTVPDINFSPIEFTALSKSIKEISYDALRSKGTGWINTYPRNKL